MWISFGIKVLSGGIFTTIGWYLTGYALTWLVSQVAMGLRHWSPVNWLATAHFPPAENNDHLISTFKLNNCCFFIVFHRRSWRRSCWCHPQPAWETFIRWREPLIWMRDMNKIMRLVMVGFLVDVLTLVCNICSISTHRDNHEPGRLPCSSRHWCLCGTSCHLNSWCQ